MAAETRSWRQVPAIERQVERRSRLFEAALDRTDRDGISAVTVRGVCADAGLTSRYFYESFTGLDDLFISLYDEVAELGVAAIVDGMAAPSDSPKGRVGNVVRAGTAFLTADPRRSRFLLVHATARPDLNRRRRQFIADVAGLGADATTRAVDLTDAESAAAIGSRFALGGLIEIATAYLEGEITASSEDFIARATDIVVAVAEGTIAHGG